MHKSIILHFMYFVPFFLLRSYIDIFVQKIT